MTIPRISKAQLYHLWALAKDVPGYTPQRAEAHLACGVIMRMCGPDWFKDYIMPGARNRNILTLTNILGPDETARQARVIDLAEMLYNLQDVENFDECVQRLIEGDVEATLAELDLGRLLYLHKVKFRYVIRVYKKGADYDVEIVYPNGIVACADAKCKIEAHEFSEKGLRNTLNKARRQMPADRPGIIFVKHPVEWAANNLGVIHNATLDFFRSSQRIVSVKYYVQPFDRRGNYIVKRHGYKEMTNPNTRFAPQNWDVFPVGTLKDLEVPDHWQSINNIEGLRKPPDELA